MTGGSASVGVVLRDIETRAMMQTGEDTGRFMRSGRDDLHVVDLFAHRQGTGVREMEMPDILCERGDTDLGSLSTNQV